MKIIVNHLTRMAVGYVCVAGIETETGSHVRPVLRGRLDSRWSSREGGPFEIGEIVDLGPTMHVGNRPEVEDWRFESDRVRSTGQTDPTQYWQLLRDSARASLPDIFGSDLQRVGQTYATPEGVGRASLGVLVPETRPSLFVDDRGSLRLALHDDGNDSSFPVTDLRFYDSDYRVREEIVHQISERMIDNVPVILSVGLTRPWQKPGDPAPRHWVQINNIHLEDDPLWPLVDPAIRVRLPVTALHGDVHRGGSPSIWNRIRGWLRIG